MIEFFNMGGYAFHVWSTWGLSFVLLAGFSVIRYQAYRRRQTQWLEQKDTSSTESL